jgi:hypothetical protein
MTRTTILSEARALGIGADYYSPGDGKTRYRFFPNPEHDYFSARAPFYTALGAAEAETFLCGFAQGMSYTVQQVKREVAL